MNVTPAPDAAPRGLSHVDALPPGTRLAEFEIQELLGVGGFGMVYKAFDHSLHRPVAIKEYMPSTLAGRSEGQSVWVRAAADQATFQAGLVSFVGEARLLAQFDHPSLVKVFRFWEANGTAYMVMPLYSGMTFKQARAQMRTPPTEAWLRKLLWSVLGALRVLHDGKTLHRDISPDNIFLQFNGPPVLLDLGAARHAINDQDRKHTAVLKVNYAPIEQYADGDEDLRQGPWSDLYSLAAVVHGCLCNDTPLPATLRSIRDRMVSFSRVARTVRRQFGIEYSAPFVAAISQSLLLKPEDRPRSIDEFLQAMEMTTPPEGSEHFDFRADLGDIWVEPTDPDAAGFITPVVNVTSAPAVSVTQSPAKLAVDAAQPARQGGVTAPASDAQSVGGDTVVLAGPDTIAVEAGDTVFIEDAPDSVLGTDSGAFKELESQRRQGAAGPRHHHRPRERNAKRAGKADRDDRVSAAGGSGKKPRVVIWLAAAVVAVVASAAGLRWSQSAKASDDNIITELAEQRAPALTPVVQPAAPSPEPAQEGLTAASATGSQGAASTPAQGIVAPQPVQVAAPSAVAASTPRAASRTARRTAPEPAPQPVVVHEEPVAPAPVPVAPEPRPRPPPPAPKLPTPQEACADASFLARPLCIHRECQKPAQASQPICVENRRKYEAEEQRRRLTPN